MKRSGLGAVVLAVSLTAEMGLAAAQEADTRGLEAREFTGEQGQRMPYRLHVPAAYDSTRAWPLVLYLHGSGGNGDDNLKQLTGGNALGSHLWSRPENQRRFPSFVLVPQTSTGWRRGGIPLAISILDHLQSEYRIDPDRIYVVGQSMGGLGTWEIITRYPQRFAAAVLIAAGGGYEDKAAAIAHMPLWILHGELDGVERAHSMVAALRAQGARPRYTEYPGAGHAIWPQAYAEPQLVSWLMAQQRQASRDSARKVPNSLLAGMGAALVPKRVPRPADSKRPRRARPQPSLPAHYAELPFVETAPAPMLTPAEEERGFLLFQRPITEPVHPNTHPLAHERLRTLVAFATPGEFEPLTFSIYPVRDLVNLRVRVSELRSDSGEIPAAALSVRLATYWNVGYPRYTSRETYRRLPELLEEVAVHSSPRGECQRWWITAQVPEGAKPGLYRGAATVWDDEMEAAVEIPIVLRVLSFKLLADPHKHYSVYAELGNRVQYGDRPEAFVRRAMGNEYRAMVELGIDTYPTLYLGYDQARDEIVLRHAGELARLRAAGMRGPLPVAGGNAIEVIYRRTTPGGQRAPHWRIDKMPPPAFYEQVEKAFARLKQKARDEDWPELIICPLDEVDASRREFGAGVYRAVRAAGFRTYITKDPLAADAAAYGEGVDIWCSQPFSVPYEKIAAQERFEYWSYPNHNAGEIKDRRVMSKGGRMTYGYGFWRSGYTALIPWHWAWTPPPDQFDYLRGSRSGTGQRIGDEGEVIEAVYWQSFREGRDDARYIYTLQQAIWEREASSDARCRRLVAAGRAALQELWDAIEVQPKYLAAGMWPSAEFNARRWRLATLTERLLSCPSLRRGPAPSVLVGDTAPKPPADEMAFIRRAIDNGTVETRDLGGDFSQWRNITREGTVSVTPQAGRKGRPGLRWQVKVDHKSDGGGEEGDYPIGWPRVRRLFAPGQLDLTDFDYLLFEMRVDSDRDEVADDSTPVGFTLHSNKFYEVTRDLGSRQRVWLPVLFPLRSLISSTGRGEEPWRSIEMVQFFISEGNYADGTHLTLDVAEVSLLRFKSPLLKRIEAPRFVSAPQPELLVGFEVVGARSARAGTHVIEAMLTGARGRVRAHHRQDLSAGEPLLLDTSQLEPGSYKLEVVITTAEGRRTSRIEQPVDFIAGPLMWGLPSSEVHNPGIGK